jgi:type I restriction enzyme R subunit
MHPASNFSFLQREFPLLANLAQAAEYHAQTEPVVALFKLRQFVEKLVELLHTVHQLPPPFRNDLHHRILMLREEDILPGPTASLLIRMKNLGNAAVHQNTGVVGEALTALESAFSIARWLAESYGEDLYTEQIGEHFVPPSRQDSRRELEELQQEYQRLQAAFDAYISARVPSSRVRTASLRQRGIQAASRMQLSEAETRTIIDEQLRSAGWEADTQALRWSAGIRPAKGRNIAIAEFPCGRLFADYALFSGLDLIGLIEAKREVRDVISDLQQSKQYAAQADVLDNVRLTGAWGVYRVPFLFSTNSRPYHPQLETKSGIWFLDVRKSNNHPAPLRGWFAPADLVQMLSSDVAASNLKLQKEPFDYLLDARGLALRPYQIEAIEAVERKIMEHSHDDPRALIAMATGTGKTRTIIGLCYRLIKSRRFRRILFLVDRNVLGIQASDAFNEVAIESALPFGKLYDLKGLNEKFPELETKVHFSTVQGMVKRILYPEEGQNPPPVGTYDCLIVDEAHRGYTLDREMDEDEIHFKDLNDYVGKYKAVLEYFNAFRIGLTATPALHTTRIFGKPVYRYSYRQAVVDGYLIDHEPPYLIRTRLSEQGIVWEKGEKPMVYDREHHRIEALDELEDELKIEIEGFNKMVITESFNQVVAEQLAQELDPESREKTLIFAANDEHADLVVKVLKDAFEAAGIEVDDDAVMKITGKTYEAQKQITRFKNERFPSIVVTVDLLSTGVDVPEICHIVFLRRVRSRILYEQMLGRATRRADHIGKQTFRIYDAVRLYEALKDVTDMTPVVANPAAGFQQLVQEMAHIEHAEAMQRQLEQLIAKLQSKKSVVAERSEHLERFQRLSGGQTPDSFLSGLKAMDPAEAGQQLPRHMELFRFLDELRGIPRRQLVSTHADEPLEMTRGYGASQKPEDYLQAFKAFIEENRNKIAALDLVCTRPRELTRKSLKELQVLLAEKGYTPSNLQTAWKQAKNEDIAADIIAYVRTMSMGVSLETPQERIERAFRHIYGMRSWNRVQLNWLERIKARLMDEIILDADFFEKEPFKSDGGFRRLDKIFQHELDTVIRTINEQLFAPTG